MKKTIICILAVLSLVVMAGCADTTEASTVGTEVAQEGTMQTGLATLAAAARPASSKTGTTGTSATKITEAAAKEIALKHAERTESEVTFIKSGLDYDDGHTVYDIEFYVGNTEYDYKIDAYNGDIHSSDYDIEDHAPVTTTTQPPSPTTSTSDTKITEAAAKKIALKHAGRTESEVTFIKSELDYDDGRTVYDIEFYVSNAEYDYEIDAYTGDIHSSDYDIESYNAQPAPSSNSAQPAPSSNSSHISMDEAKTIALNKAGLSASEVTFTKAKLDYDDGYTVYEITFIVGRMEYEFEINADTGAIIEYDADYDD